MSIFLVGGDSAPEPYGTAWPEFVREAAAFAKRHGRDVPRIGVILLDGPSGDTYSNAVAASLRAAGECDPIAVRVAEGGVVEQSALADLDALYIAGGLTPGYHRAVEPVVGEIRRLVASGLPYLGFSAGAQIAAEHAIIGGYRIGGVVVAPEETGEELDDVTVAQGIGLVDITVDVHAAQWGTIGRLIAATEAGLVDGGVAIDESTALVVSEGGLRVIGTGSVWQVIPTDAGVRVSTIAAE